MSDFRNLQLDRSRSKDRMSDCRDRTSDCRDRTSDCRDRTSDSDEGVMNLYSEAGKHFHFTISVIWKDIPTPGTSFLLSLM